VCILYIVITTIFVIGILAIYYIGYNYMLRPLMFAIFRLHMDLSSSYTTYVGCFLGGCMGKVFFWWDRDLLCVSGGCTVWNNIIVVHVLVLAMSRIGFIMLS